MVDREKVIRGLTVCTDSTPAEVCMKCPYQGEDHCTDTVMMDALDILKEQEPVPDMGGWVSVQDRLPEETESMFTRFHGTEKWDNAMWLKESKQVLVSIEFPDGGRRVTLGRLHDSEWHTTVSVILPHTVTHWMPLPEPPKGVK